MTDKTHDPITGERLPILRSKAAANLANDMIAGSAKSPDWPQNVLSRQGPTTTNPALRDAEEPVAIVPLAWEPIEQARSDEDPTTEIVGWEASTPFETFYTIEQYFGSDSLGWEVSHSNDDIGDSDDPDKAKAIAQEHFASCVRSVLYAHPPASRADDAEQARRWYMHLATAALAAMEAPHADS